MKPGQCRRHDANRFRRPPGLTAAPRGDIFLVPVSAENRGAADVKAGDEVEVELTGNAESLRRSRCCAKAEIGVDLKYRLESVFVVPLLAHLGESVLPHELA